MTPTRIKWTLYILPALIIGGFETLRHTILENMLPTELGNWVTAIIDTAVIALFSRTLFRQFERALSELTNEREARAVLQDRERLARALHDEIAQTIFYAGAQLSSIESEVLLHGDSTLVNRLRDLHALLRELDDSTRQAIHNLKQAPLNTFDLEEQIYDFLTNTFAPSNLRFIVNIDRAVTESLSLEYNMQLFVIVKEAITNALKHSGAREVQVCMSSDGTSGRWRLEIRDDGVGFDPSMVPTSRFGIETMQRRARGLNAQFTIDSTTAGTVVTIDKDVDGQSVAL